MTRPPPDGFEFIGAVPTGDPACWLIRCPSCVGGAVAIVPATSGWRLAAELGCADGCDAPEIQWWHLWRQGYLPPPPPPDDRQRRYAQGAVRRILAEIPERPTAERLRGVAYRVGQFAEAGELEIEPLTKALGAAASRVGITNNNILLAAMMAGRAAPARLPL